MTNHNRPGILSCEIDADIKHIISNKDGLTPVMYDNLDINKKYRMAVAIQRNFDEPISLCLI